MPKKSFTKGRKQEYKILFMYYWLYDIECNDDYRQEYLESVMLGLYQFIRIGDGKILVLFFFIHKIIVLRNKF